MTSGRVPGGGDEFQCYLPHTQGNVQEIVMLQGLLHQETRRRSFLSQHRGKMSVGPSHMLPGPPRPASKQATGLETPIDGSWGPRQEAPVFLPTCLGVGSQLYCLPTFSAPSSSVCRIPTLPDYPAPTQRNWRCSSFPVGVLGGSQGSMGVDIAPKTCQKVRHLSRCLFLTRSSHTSLQAVPTYPLHSFGHISVSGSRSPAGAGREPLFLHCGCCDKDG